MERTRKRNKLLVIFVMLAVVAGLFMAMPLVASADAQETLTVTGDATATYVDGLTITYSTTGGSGDGAVSFEVAAGGTGAGSFSGSILTVTKAGTIQIKATKAADPDSNPAYDAAESAVFTLIVAKADPTIATWPSAAAITYGQALSDATLSGQSNTTAGTFAFTNASDKPTVAQSGNFEVTFTPTNADNYKTATNNVSVTVNAASIYGATATIADQPYTGSVIEPAVSGVTLGGTDLTSDDYDVGSYSDNTDIGTDTASVSITGKGNYTGTATLNFSIIKATPTITTPPTAAAITYGQTLANATLSDGVASVDGDWAFSDPTEEPDVADSGDFEVTFTPTDTTHYTTATVNVAVTVNKADPDITTWPDTASDITYGETLANSTLSGETTVTPGTFAFTASTTKPAVSDSGTTTYGVTFTPTDTANYNTDTDTGLTLTVNAASISGATATIADQPYTGSAIKPAVSGVTLGGTSLTSDDYDVGSYSDNTDIGTDTASVSITGKGNYTGTATLNFSIIKATPTITTPPTAAAITYGQTLANATLSDGVASVDGDWAFSDPTEEPDVADSGDFEVTFTPTDTTHYTTATVNVAVTVNKANPTVTFPSNVSLTYGTALSGATIGTAGSGVGTFAFSAPDTIPTVAESGDDFEMTFTPTDADNYNTKTESVAVAVSKAAAPTGADQTVEVLINTTQQVSFDLTRLLPDVNPLTLGTVTYSASTTDGDNLLTTDPSGAVTSPLTLDVASVADVGTVATITVTVTSANYEDFTADITVETIDKYPVVIDATMQGGVYNGIPRAYSGATVTSTNEANLDVTSSVTLDVLYMGVNGTTYNSATAPTNVGEYQLTLSVPASNTRYSGTETFGFTITPATLKITADNKAAVIGAAQPAYTYTVTGLVGSETLTTEPTFTCAADMYKPGAYAIVPAGAAASGNYTITYANGTLTVSNPDFNDAKGVDEGETINAASDAGFTVEATFTDLASVTLNGTELGMVRSGGTWKLFGYPGYSSYIGEAKAGSVVITLYKDFLNFLGNGEYTLSVALADNNGTGTVYASPVTTFKVELPAVTQPTQPGTGSTNTDTGTTTTTTATAPQTGDESNIILWIVLLTVSMAGVVTAVLVWRNGNKKKAAEARKAYKMMK